MGRPYRAVGGGGNGGDGWTSQLQPFAGRLPDAGDEIHLGTTEGEVAVELSVQVPETTEPVDLTLVLEEALLDDGTSTIGSGHGGCQLVRLHHHWAPAHPDTTPVRRSSAVPRPMTASATQRHDGDRTAVK